MSERTTLGQASATITASRAAGARNAAEDRKFARRFLISDTIFTIMVSFIKFHVQGQKTSPQHLNSCESLREVGRVRGREIHCNHEEERHCL